MHKTNIPLALCLFLSLCGAAQGKHDNIWFFGYGSNDPSNGFGGSMIDFSGGEPEISYFYLPSKFSFFYASSSFADSDGGLLFYTNGCKLFNADNEVMENGEGLGTGASLGYYCEKNLFAMASYQEMFALAMPGHPDRYLLIHPARDLLNQTLYMLYSEIDMSANGGKGRVTYKNRLLLETSNNDGAFAAVRHGNGRDWWIVNGKWDSNRYYLYLVSPEGISGPFVQDFQGWGYVGSMGTGWNTVFSPDGTKFVRVTLRWESDSVRYNRLFIYDFDRCTGTLCNQKVVRVDDIGAYASWAAISPNSRYLYLQMAQDKLYQFDLHAADISASRQLVGEYDGFRDEKGFYGTFHSMALAPNGKIYMGTTSTIRFLHTIHAPDEPGLACDFRQHDLELPTVSSSVLPNFPNYRLWDAPGSLCDTLGIDSPFGPPQPSGGSHSRPAVRLSPNPASFMVMAHLDKPASVGRLRVFSMTGQLLYEAGISGTIPFVCFSVEGWPKGTYVVRVEQEGSEAWTGKLVVVGRG